MTESVSDFAESESKFLFYNRTPCWVSLRSFANHLYVYIHPLTRVYIHDRVYKIRILIWIELFCRRESTAYLPKLGRFCRPGNRRLFRSNWRETGRFEILEVPGIIGVEQHERQLTNEAIPANHKAHGQEISARGFKKGKKNKKKKSETLKPGGSRRKLISVRKSSPFSRMEEDVGITWLTVTCVYGAGHRIS